MLGAINVQIIHRLSFAQRRTNVGIQQYRLLGLAVVSSTRGHPLCIERHLVRRLVGLVEMYAEI